MAHWGSYLARGLQVENTETSQTLSEMEEIKKLITIAKNQSVKDFLLKHLKQLEFQSVLKDYNASTSQPTQASPLATISNNKHENLENSLPAKRKMILGTGTYIPIESFAWDQDGFSSPVINVYIDLPGVGKAKQNCEIDFTKMSFDFKVTGLDGKNYRLLKDNLEKDIIPEQSKMTVKANRVILKLQKVKGEYSYEHWNNLTAKKPREATADKKKDPMGGIMDMMKDMYEEGDENMRKIIGEAMLKSQRGEKSGPPSMDEI
jgi:calcyclin binding protein